jgi:UDP-2,3-diacylglucosamine pyrophosphatase LpxH
MLGDLFESSAASVHPDEHDHTLADEYAAGAEFLSNIRAILPKKIRLHWMLGNHDDNLQAQDSRRTDWRTRDLIHWNQSQFADIFLKWKQYPYRKPSVHDQSGCLQLGQVIFSHGYDAGGNSDELEGLQMTYACGGHSHRLTVRGHTHRPTHGIVQSRRTSKILLPFWYANAGTMGPLQPQYMSRKDVSQWAPAIVWGECKVNTPSRFAAKEWHAGVELL